MPQDDLDAAVRAYQEAQDAIPAAQERARQVVAEARVEVERARERLAAAIVRAAKRGMRQKDIAERTGYTRETVRRICRAAGIEPD
jgi:DNA-binding NarL/FixJ family response regulator